MHSDRERDALLDRCESEGRIVRSSRPAWATRYDNDPAGTVQVLAALAPLPVDPSDETRTTADAGLALVRGAQRGTSFTPELAHEPVQAQHPRPVQAAEAKATPKGWMEQVKAWTRDLFPETAAPETESRIHSDGSYKPGQVA